MTFFTRLFFLFCAAALLAAPAFSQNYLSVETQPMPEGGINKLALVYLKIDFTKEQRTLLQEIPIEFIYGIDTAGVATLEKVNGISDKAILDSLYRKNPKLPPFQPGTINGVKTNSIYMMQLQFPKYKLPANYVGMQEAIHYQQTAYEDFEYIHLSGQKVDVLFGGAANAFVGNPGKYLKPGGGFRTAFMLTGKKGYGGGMAVSFYGNKLKKDYPIASDREQNDAPPTMLIGVAANKALIQKERKEFNLQVELNYAIQNITPNLGNNDQDWTQFSGFSPGLVGNYLFQIGKNKVGYYYTTPSVYNHHLNIHAAVRPVFFNQKEASGLMVEVGLSYLMRNNFVDEYKIKPKPGN